MPCKKNFVGRQRVAGTYALLLALAAGCFFPLFGVNALSPYATERGDGGAPPFLAPSGRSNAGNQAPLYPMATLRETSPDNVPIPSAPATNRSYYISVLTPSKAYNYGLSRGQADVNLSTEKGFAVDSAVILAFGKPHVANDGVNFNCGGNPGDFATLLLLGGVGCRADIKTYVQNFIFGYINGMGQGRSRLTLIIGVNNTDDTGQNSMIETYPHEAAGKDWGNLGNELDDYIFGNGYQDHILVVGGDDIETGPSIISPIPSQSRQGYEPPNLTRLWLKGYNETSGNMLFDFGDSGGCPANDHSGAGLCDGYWYQRDVREVSMTGVAFPLPEIYVVPPEIVLIWTCR